MNKFLNKDIDINADKYGKWDISTDQKNLKILTGLKCLENGIIISILTRYNELKKLPSFNNFGCRAHEIIKAKKTNLNEFKLRTYIKESVEAMNRIESVDSLDITSNVEGYNVKISCTSISGERVNTEVNL